MLIVLKGKFGMEMVKFVSLHVRKMRHGTLKLVNAKQQTTNAY